MVEISKGKLFGVIHSFQRYKSLGPDKVPMEFYFECSYFVGNSILRVVETNTINL